MGNISFQIPAPGEPRFSKPFSQSTAQLIDDEVRELISNAHNATTQLLTQHKENVQKVRSDRLQIIIFDDYNVCLSGSYTLIIKIDSH